MKARYLLLVLVTVAACDLDNSNKNKCATQDDCTGDNVCNLATGVCEKPGECMPATCDDRCGMIDDGCGATLTCGCTLPEVCGAGGPGLCGEPPPHCSNGMTDQGETDKDCGGACGGCVVGQTCGDTDDCAVGTTCEASKCISGTWARLADMPTTRQRTSVVYGPDGLFYVIGGIRNSNPGGTTGVVEAYNPTTDSWTTKAPMPTPRYGMAAVVAGGKIYAIGGPYQDDVTPFTDGESVLVEIYDPTTNTWTSGPSLPNGRYNPAATVGADGNIYITGGLSMQPTETVANIAKLVPGGVAWTTVAATMTTPRQQHTLTAGDNDRLYAAGGFSSDSTDTAALEYYVLGASGWNTAPPMQFARKFPSAAFVGNKLYVIGGNGSCAGSSYCAVVEAYDPSTNSWSRVASLPSGRYGHGSAVSAGGKIYVFGGTRATANPQNPGASGDTKVVEVFTP